jgi:cyclophilin family peptidyl-prolyl cis-trans isomerase
VGTQKRERQKLNRNLKLEEIAKVNQAATRKRNLIRWTSIIAVAVIAIIAIALASRKPADKVTTAANSTVAPQAPTTAAAAAAAAKPFAYGTGECAAVDGSAAKTTKFTVAPKQCIDPAKTYTAKIETTKGAYTAVLDAVKAPGTVNNFVNLARFHYFDEISCHRIIKGFMAQCGDPTGTGGGGPGYSIPDELPASQAEYQPGTLAMANSGPNTSGSQFFTMFRGGLPPQYSIFGKVTEGMDTTVKALDAVGADADPKPPTEKVSITKVTITES